MADVYDLTTIFCFPSCVASKLTTRIFHRAHYQDYMNTSRMSWDRKNDSPPFMLLERLSQSILSISIGLVGTILEFSVVGVC